MLFADSMPSETDPSFALELAKKSQKESTGGFDDQVARIDAVISHNSQNLNRKISIMQKESDTGSMSLIVFDEPLDVKNTKLLNHSDKQGNDKQWLYLPKIKRVKRIESNQKNSKFMGSEFTFEDLRSQEVARFNYTFQGKQVYQDETCYLLKRLPRLKTTAYSYQMVFIDQMYRMQKIEYYDQDNSLLKTLDFNKYELLQKKYWRATEMVMKNQHTGDATSLNWKDFLFDQNIDDSKFEPYSLEY